MAPPGRSLERLVETAPRASISRIFTDSDGSFPNHHPDPTVEANLADLKALVAEHGLDFGIAFDGDGDRIGAVDGLGRVIWGDQLLAILAGPVLKAEPGATIIADVKASQVLFDAIAALGGKPLMWKTGHSLIKSKMKETGAPLAGEMSGHIFFKHRWYGFDDALYAAVRLIEAVAASGKSLTEIMDVMPKSVATPEMRFPVDEARKFAVVEEVRERLSAEGASVDSTDGVRVTTARRLVAASRLEHAGRAGGAGRGQGRSRPRPPRRADRRAARPVWCHPCNSESLKCRGHAKDTDLKAYLRYVRLSNMIDGVGHGVRP